MCEIPPDNLNSPQVHAIRDKPDGRHNGRFGAVRQAMRPPLGVLRTECRPCRGSSKRDVKTCGAT
jgi:hypothetical protein